MHNPHKNDKSNPNGNSVLTGSSQNYSTADLSSSENVSTQSSSLDKTNTSTPELVKHAKLVPNQGKAFTWYLLSLLVIAIDQWTKWLATSKLSDIGTVSVIDPILNWTLAYNPGAAFSLLADQPGWQKWFFSGLSIIMSILLIVYLFRAPRQAKFLNVGLALILGGAIGNLIDRLRIDKVIDFIHVHYADVWHYPIFNIADIAICVGVAIVIIDMLFFEKKRNEAFAA